MTGRRASALLLFGVIVAACGVPHQSSPTSLENDHVRVGAPSTTTSLPQDTPKQPVALCLVDGDRLTTTIVELASPVSAADAIDGLIDVSRTALPPTTRSVITGSQLVTAHATTHGVANVELNPSFLEIPPADQILAIAQIVCTLTGVPGVGQVQFLQNGQPVNVPRADSSLTERPVSREDYAPLLPAAL
jgi:spore germination protein GerM